MYKYLLWPLAIFLFSCSGQTDTESEIHLWEKQAKRVTITRDSFGVPHISGETDADAVFGMVYAQCEDDFNRVEMNYINASGRLAEVMGEDEVFRDLRMKMYIDPEDMKERYHQSPDWLKELMVAFADGINYYLYKHPEVKPKVITRFEPWMALTFSEGSIGGDIETISIRDLKEFYGDTPELVAYSETPSYEEEPRGSNGISISPSITKDGNTLFLINPHTTFFFRSEVHMKSNQGLNAYGAVTWGQFFIYQGFNERLGWMHTSSRADAIDEFIETIIEKDGKYYYQFGDEEREVRTRTIKVPYKTDQGMAEKEFSVYYTHRGPVIRKEGDNWVSVSMMFRPVDALKQSYLRTKAKNYDEFFKTMEIRTNSSNNTVYADADGNIAYFHGNFIPRRDPSFDWSKPVDGSDPRTEWGELHTVEEMVMIKNPENGWIQNCNATPFTASGDYSPSRDNYPIYVAPDRENFRGLHAVKVLEGQTDWTLEKLMTAAYDPYLTGFDKIVPMLLAGISTAEPELKGPVDVLRNWDRKTGEESVATSVAVYYGQELLRLSWDSERRGDQSVYEFMETGTTQEEKMEAFKSGIDRLVQDFGTWEVPWGEINRYQRNDEKIRQDFNDDLKSLPVGMNSGRWGALASYGSRTYPGTKKMYGTSGNSFVAFVEFGDKVKAKSILTGGQSGDPNSPHFNDQALMYTKGEFKDVKYYEEDIKADAKRTYSPGE